MYFLLMYIMLIFSSCGDDGNEDWENGDKNTSQTEFKLSPPDWLIGTWKNGDGLGMLTFQCTMFGRENMISEGSTISENDTICINIKYHKIGEVFNYKVGMSEMTLRVDKCDRCSGCAFENYIYDCVKSGCLGCEREDGESVRYTIVNT